MKRVWGAWCLATLGACVSLDLPSSIRLCGVTDCAQSTEMPIFWGAERPPYAVEPLGVVQVEASEVPHLSSMPVTREQLLESLALKARALGANALAQARVSLPPGMPEPVPAGAQTQLSGSVTQGSASALAVRRRP